MKTTKSNPETIPSVDVQASSPEPIITARGVVYPWQCDHVGHMNVMWYTGKFDEATWQLFGRIGVTPTYLRTNSRGMAAVHQETTYKRELMAGDLITIRSRILEMREKVVRFHHEMQNDETLDVVATTTLTGVHLDTKRRKSCPFSKEILECGRRLISRAGK